MCGVSDRIIASLVLRLGLIMALLTIAVDPFSQQLLQLRQDVEYIDELDYSYAIASRATTYEGGKITSTNASLSSIRTDRPAAKDARKAVPEFSMEAAILNGLSQPTEMIHQLGGVASCPTGNCTWESFNTLGVCHRCANVTNKLEKIGDFGDFFNMMNGDDPDRRIDTGNATALVLPNGQFLANQNGCGGKSSTCYLGPGSPSSANSYVLTTYSTGDWKKTLSFKGIDTLIRSMSAIYMDGRRYDELYNHTRDNNNYSILDPEYYVEDEDRDGWKRWPKSPVTAMECAVYFCAKDIRARMAGNVLTEEATESDDWRRARYEPKGLSGRQVEENEDNVDANLSLQFNATAHDDTQIQLYIELTGGHSRNPDYYWMKPEAYLPITALLEDILKDSWHNETNVLKRVRKRIPHLEHMFDGAILGESDFKPEALKSMWSDFSFDLERTFESLATSMTNEIRMNGVNTEDEIHGKIGISRTAYRVVWYWLSLHGLIFVGSVVFCIETMMVPGDVPVWKSHSLATMSQGHAIVDFGTDAKSLRELEKRAQGAQVSLLGDGDGKLCRQRNRSTEDGSSGTGDDVEVAMGRRSPV